MEVVIDGIVYVPKEKKLELDLLEEKYKSGDYIVIYYSTAINNWNTVAKNRPLWGNNVKYKLIHKKHKEILDAWLADNSVEIEYHIERDLWAIDKNFIDKYEEDCEYRLKQQYSIFKRNKDGEVFRFDNIYGFSTVLAKDFEATHLGQGETIPYDKERGLYHLQPCWIYEENLRFVDFYNVREKRTIEHLTGWNSTFKIEPITPEQLKVMPFIWSMYQQVLKDNK